MDRIEKALRKFSPKERAALKKILQQIADRNFLGLDVKKLKGSREIYRVRKGDLRIIFQKRSGDGFNILSIERRSDTTYGRF